MNNHTQTALSQIDDTAKSSISAPLNPVPKLWNINTITPPFLLDKHGNKVYQILYYPYKVPKVVPHYDRESGLGYFHKFSRVGLREFLDDYLDVKSLLALAVTSREFFLVCSDEKLWRRIAKRMFKGNIPFQHTWRQSILAYNHEQYNKRIVSNEDKKIVKFTAPDITMPPHWTGMEEELSNRFKVWYRTVINPRWLELQCPTHHIDRRSGLTVEEFIQQYEIPGKPVIITDAMKEWPANRNWTLAALLRKYGQVKFRTGSGFSMTLENFVRYMESQHEHRPLYLFDQKYAQNAKEMLNDYTIPIYFREDLFALAEEERPPYRWILIGGCRTGAPFHTDPRGTAAWNAVVFGKKRWILHPPHEQPIGVGPDNSDYYNAPGPLRYLLEIYPKIKPTDPHPLECIQYPGEIIYVPGGWWHMVINIEDPTIAVTQNFASTANFRHLVRELVKDMDDEDDDFYPLFRRRLKERRPDLFQILRDAEKKYQEETKRQMQQ
jgi:hypothetical protein